MSIAKFIVVLAALAGATAPVAAQDWPTRPLVMVVPYAAGGTTDVIGRILSARLSEVLHQTVIVENVGGAGGMSGVTRVAKAAPDGYQFVLGNVGTHAQNQTLYKNPSYHAATDFAPVGLLVDQPTVLIARKDLPADDLPGFIAYAKANQAKMQYGSAGAGSPTHLSCALLNAAIGLNVTHVPYRGGGPAMQDLIAGRIDYVCLNIGGSFPQIEAKTVKAIAILTGSRSPILPNIATAQEQGLKDFEVGNWLAFFLPKGTSPAIVAKLNEAAITTLNTPAVQMRLSEIGVEPVAPQRRSPDYLGKFVVAEIEKWAGPIKAAGVTSD
jgi:tripartite-type tricarboxylate transporter receptor subunit TctC